MSEQISSQSVFLTALKALQRIGFLLRISRFSLPFTRRLSDGSRFSFFGWVLILDRGVLKGSVSWCIPRLPFLRAWEGDNVLRFIFKNLMYSPKVFLNVPFVTKLFLTDAAFEMTLKLLFSRRHIIGNVAVDVVENPVLFFNLDANAKLSYSYIY